MDDDAGGIHIDQHYVQAGQQVGAQRHRLPFGNRYRLPLGMADHGHTSDLLAIVDRAEGEQVIDVALWQMHGDLDGVRIELAG